jgi:hypothetical protein
MTETKKTTILMIDSREAVNLAAFAQVGLGDLGRSAAEDDWVVLRYLSIAQQPVTRSGGATRGRYPVGTRGEPLQGSRPCNGVYASSASRRSPPRDNGVAA